MSLRRQRDTGVGRCAPQAFERRVVETAKPTILSRLQKSRRAPCWDFGYVQSACDLTRRGRPEPTNDLWIGLFRPAISGRLRESILGPRTSREKTASYLLPGTLKDPPTTCA